MKIKEEISSFKFYYVSRNTIVESTLPDNFVAVVAFLYFYVFPLQYLNNCRYFPKFYYNYFCI